jgi:hypothetical protein
MAASNTMAAFGYVSWLREKKLAVPRSTYFEHRACRYSPKPDAAPENTITKMPRAIPNCDIACGMASTPAPRMVFRRFTTLLIHDACP